MKTGSQFVLSAMTAADLAAVIAIERQNPAPWSEAELKGEIDQPTGWQWLARDPATTTIIGYIIGRTVVDEVEILRLAVTQSHRRRGVAQQLLEHAFSDLRRTGTTSCFLELRAGNTKAQLLYKKNGFQAIGIRYNYYHSPDEDAVVMTKSLSEEGASS